MKRRNIVLLIVLGVIFLAGNIFLSYCMRNEIPYQGERPYNYPPARWISEAPDIWFDVVENDENPSEREKPKGQLVLDGEVIEIVVSFNYKDGISIRENINSVDRLYLRGTCEFNPDKLVVTVDKENDFLLNGAYDTITFIRIPKEEE